MSTLDIQQPTTLPAAQTRQVADQIAVTLQEKFGLECRWQGDVLGFSRNGVEGHIALKPNLVEVHARLGFPYSMMSPMIEDEIRRVLSEKLG